MKYRQTGQGTTEELRRRVCYSYAVSFNFSLFWFSIVIISPIQDLRRELEDKERTTRDKKAKEGGYANLSIFTEIILILLKFVVFFRTDLSPKYWTHSYNIIITSFCFLVDRLHLSVPVWRKSKLAPSMQMNPMRRYVQSYFPSLSSIVSLIAISDLLFK